MLRYDIVLLDADETIFDFHRAERTAIAATLREFSVDPTDEVISLYSEGNLRCWKALERGELDRAQLKITRFRMLFESLSRPDVDLAAVNLSYEINLSRCGFMLPGAEDFLKKLRSVAGLRIYLATNGFVIPQEGRYHRTGSDKYMDGIYISEQVGANKPAPEYFDYVFSDIGVTDRSRAIILGDSLTSDMLGGRNAGIATCLYLNGRSPLHSPLCDYEISSYDEFFDIIIE